MAEREVPRTPRPEGARACDDIAQLHDVMLKEARAIHAAGDLLTLEFLGLILELGRGDARRGGGTAARTRGPTSGAGWLACTCGAVGEGHGLEILRVRQ